MVVFGLPTFLFAWVILNPEAQAFGALLEGRVAMVFGLVIAYSIMTVGVWAYFLITKGSSPPIGGIRPPSGGGPPVVDGPPTGDPQLVPQHQASGPIMRETSPNHFTVVDESQPGRKL